MKKKRCCTKCRRFQNKKRERRRLIVFFQFFAFHIEPFIKLDFLWEEACSKLSKYFFTFISTVTLSAPKRQNRMNRMIGHDWIATAHFSFYHFCEIKFNNVQCKSCQHISCFTHVSDVYSAILTRILSVLNVSMVFVNITRIEGIPKLAWKWHGLTCQRGFLCVCARLLCISWHVA